MLRQAVWSLLVVVLCVRGAAAQTVWPGEDWETATPASQGLDAGGLEKAKAWLESHNSKSGVVIRHGRIVAEWYFGGADRQSKFAAYSTSKSLSSMATGLAIADGKLALDHTVGQYVPDASPDGKRAVTVKQLLSMSSGVHNDPGIGQREDLFSYALRTAPMDHEPGAKWDYNNTGLALLSPVFQKATGKQIAPSIGPTRTEEDFVLHVSQTVATDPLASWVFIVDNLNIHASEGLVKSVAQTCNLDEELGKKRQRRRAAIASNAARVPDGDSHGVSLLPR